MKNAIILHGLPTKDEYYDPARPASSNCHWLPWLQRQLILKDIKADTPEMFKAYAPKWEDWVKEVERLNLGSETLAVGHSMGGGFWVRYLSEHPDLKVDRVVLVAPWLNTKHEEDIDFFDFQINPDILKQAKSFTIFESDNDFEDVQDSIKLLKEKLPNAKYKTFHKYGHFCYGDMKTVEFPELLEECLK